MRIFVQWQAIAPANDVRAPAGFNSADPNSPGYNWSRVDRAVNLVSAAGMRPMLVVTGPGPLWASQVPARHNVRYKPRPDLFAEFARAAALRYGGAVDRWIIWNEPNLPLWLQPQNTCAGGAARPTRRTCTAGSCAPPTRRSRRSTRLERALRRPGAAAARTPPSRTLARGRWPSCARWGASR